jgi:hypothetical protein
VPHDSLLSSEAMMAMHESYLEWSEMEAAPIAHFCPT